MGIRNNQRIMPTWVQALDAIIAKGNVTIYARCDKCGAQKLIDVPALAAKVGGSYSLLNRRCRCKLTEGCPGWNRFSYSTGTWTWRLWDDDTDMRWFLGRSALAKAPGAR